MTRRTDRDQRLGIQIPDHSQVLMAPSTFSGILFESQKEVFGRCVVRACGEIGGLESGGSEIALAKASGKDLIVCLKTLGGVFRAHTLIDCCAREWIW